MLNFSKRNKLVVIETGERWLKIAVLQRSGHDLKITELRAVKLQDPERQLTQSLKELLDKEGRDKADFVAIFPRRLLTVKHMRLPSQNPAELDKIIRFQAYKQIPYAQEEITVNHLALGVDKEGYSNVMVFITPKNQLDKVVNVFRQTGIFINMLTLDMEGLQNYILLDKENEKAAKESAVAVLDVDIPYANLLIILKGKMVFSRSISYAKTLVEPIDKQAQKDSMQILFDELRRSLAAYEKEDNYVPVNKVLISGLLADTKDLSDKISESLNLPVGTISLFKEMPMQETARQALLAAYKDQCISFASLLGTALSHDKLKINLLPTEMEMQRKRNIMKKDLVMTTVLLSALLILGVTMLVKNFYDKKTYLAMLDKHLATLEPKAKSVEEIRKKLSIVQKYDKQKGLVAVSMREVYNLMPANVSLAMFTFDSIDGIILRGSANTMPDVVRLSEALNKSPNFRNTEIKYISERVTGSGKVIDFQIRSQIKR